MTWAMDEKGYSQRRACALVGMEPKTYRYPRGALPMRRSGGGCGRRRRSGGASATGACTSCCAARAWS